MSMSDLHLEPLTSSGAPAELEAGYQALVDAALDLQALPSKVVHLGLAMTFQNKGADDDARRHGERALAEGLTKPEVVEALLAGILSRGVGMLHANRWLVDRAAEGQWEPPNRGERMTTAQILEYFSGNFGEVPSWLQALAASSGPTLEAYYAMRAEALRDGALLRKHKELILVIINSSERYHFGMDVHMKGAVAAGATRAELLEAVRTSIVSGGMVAWIEAADVAERALAPSS